MSRHNTNKRILALAVTAAITLAVTPQAWSVSANSHSAGHVNVVNTATPPGMASVELRLAMMDDMDEMSKMNKMKKKDDQDSMKKNSGMGSMGGKKDDKMKGKMPPDSSMQEPMNASDPMATPSNMDMMGRMRGAMQARDGMRNMTSAAALPGFPGASHIYHVGASGFFLDHAKKIALSSEQQTTLNKIREKATLERTTFDRRIDEAEQELWTFTSSDTPDAAKVEAKVRAIEALRGDQRIGFIRAVGDAAKVLTPYQREIVLGGDPMANGNQSMTGTAKSPVAGSTPTNQNAGSTSKSANPSPSASPSSDAAPMSAPMKDR